MSTTTRILVVLALAILCAGCATRTRLNPEAEKAMYVASTKWMFDRIPKGYIRADVELGAYFDPYDDSITFNETLGPWLLARTMVHEMGHCWEKYPDKSWWDIVRMYDSPRFSFNLHRPEVNAINMAIFGAEQHGEIAKPDGPRKPTKEEEP